LLKGVIDTSMIASASDWLQRLAREFDLTHEDLYRVDLCCAELVTNVVSYAEAQYANTPLELHAAIEPQRLTLTVIDSAQAFDPRSVQVPPVAGSIEELQVGGQGIHLVREFSDACNYERTDGQNRLQLVFNLAVPTGAQEGKGLIPRRAERRDGAGRPSFPLQRSDGTTIESDQRCGSDRRAHGFLSSVQMFRNVPYSALEGVVDRFPVERLAVATTVLKRGESNMEVLVVLDGRLRVYLDQPGSGDSIEIGAGGCVGEMSVIDNQPVSAFVVADEGTTLLRIDGASFLNDVMTIPGVSRNLMSALSDRMRRGNEELIRRLRNELEMEHMQRELQYARSIQTSLLPREPLLPDDPRLDCVGRMCTAREVGGDLYDVFALDSERIFFVIADVCGKGLPAALFMVRAMAALRAQQGEPERPTRYTEQLAAHLNRQLCAYNDAKQFLTAFCGILDLGTRTLHYVNAGHNAPLLALGEGPFAYLVEPINPIVGMVEGLEYRAGEVRLTPRSVLLLYTDGVTEAEDGEANMLGEERLLARLNAAASRTARDLVDAVFAEVDEFAGDAPQSDDITVLAIRLVGAGGGFA
jgi:sigma-B regulation protein RsbU (phosphoserine phosphatase)